MQLEEGELEDGEIEESDDGLDPYTPLERPSLNTVIKEVKQLESDNESDRKFSSNSDSEEDFRPKKAKMRRIIHPPKKNTNKKYSVWCKDPNEHLTDFLGSFGMINPENDRSVESYPLPFQTNRKRKVPARKVGFASAKLDPIYLEELEASETSTFESLADDIAKKLSEDNYDLILRIVIICGKEKAIEFYKRTKDIESDGGLLIVNKSRRRTSGGVFILIVRTCKGITQDQKNEIFEESHLRRKNGKNKDRKLERQQNFKEWLDKMKYEKEIESGQEEPNNPPPSPEPHCPEPLPELRLRRDIISYGDLNLHQSTDSEDAQDDGEQDSQLLRKGDPINFISSKSDRLTVVPPQKLNSAPSPQKQFSQNSSDSAQNRDVVEYDDLCSMELIYD